MRSSVCIGLVLGALYLIHSAAFGWYIADDAGISLAYARNLVKGFGPALYPGGPAVEGYSNPLWVALLAVGAALRLDGGYGIPLMKIVGLALGAVTLVLTWRLGRRAYPDGELAWLAPLLLAAWTPFVFWNGAGLENGLYACVLVLAALLQLRELDDPRAAPWSAVALLAVALTRPEGCAFFLAFALHRLMTGGVRGWRQPAVWTSIFVLGLAAFLALRYFMFGAWLPNTYDAKVMDRSLGRLASYAFDADDPGREYLVDFGRAWWPVAVAAALGLADLRRWRVNLLFAGVIGGTAAYALYVGGDFWPAGRFFTAVLPFTALAAQHGIARTLGQFRYAAPGVALVLVAAVAVSSLHASLDLRRRHHEDTLISLQGRLEQGLKVRALAASYGVEDPLYLDPDIGGPTLTGLRVLDLGGLTDIHIAKFHYFPAFFRQYIFEEQRPHFIRTHATWTRSSRITQYPEFAAQYRAIREYRDARGLHGLFVRRDLATGAGPRGQASFGAARELARAIRRREAQRERDGWIEYDSATGRHERLLARFRAEEAAGTLPPDPQRLRELYFALLAAGDRDSARRVAGRAGITPGLRGPADEPVVLRAGDAEVMTLVDFRLVQRAPDPTTVLVLYLEPLTTRAGDASLWIHLHPADGSKKLTRSRDLRAVFEKVDMHRTTALEIPLYVPAGDYDIRIGAVERGSEEPFCIDTARKTCYLLLGTHPIGR